MWQQPQFYQYFICQLFLMPIYQYFPLSKIAPYGIMSPDLQTSLSTTGDLKFTKQNRQ